MREIVLDTETTGLDVKTGDRLIEIGCLELSNLLPTGRHYHCYINPERPVHPDAIRVHGLDDEFLANKPLFAEVAEDFLAFIGDDPLVIHNADFDVGFLDSELGLVGKPPLAKGRIVDTLAIARRRYPGARASLDALCQRFEIDRSNRTLHGALIDCELLAQVYLHLRGGPQPVFDLDGTGRGGGVAKAARRPRQPRPARPHAARPEELAAHREMLALLDEPLWKSLGAID